MNPKFFPKPGDFREWLAKNYDKSTEQWIGFYKRNSGRLSITWPESVDVALCYGWIDGLRKSIDEVSYMIRFTPRKSNSHWSTVNINRVADLKKQGLMQKPGLEAFNKRKAEKSARAAHEQKNVAMDESFEVEFRKNERAWIYWESKTPSYRKQCTWWVMSAKREATRSKRLAILIESSEGEEVIPPLKWSVKKR